MGISGINDLSDTQVNSNPVAHDSGKEITNRFSLPVCAQKMLREGVTHHQRVSCYRLAVHLKRIGLPYDVAIAALKVWSRKNNPREGKQVITEREIVEQTSYAFNKDYRGYGCNSEAVTPFCQAECPVNRLKEGSIPAISEP